MRLWRAVLWAGIAAVGLSSCAAPPPLRRDWRYEEGIGALLLRLDAEMQGIDDLAAQARIRLHHEGRRQEATASILYKRPSLLRLEVRGGPLFSRLFTVVMEGDSVSVVGRKRPGWKGTVQGPLLARLTGVDLGMYPLEYALLGLVAPGRVDTARATEYPRGDRAVVPLDGGRRVWIDLYSGLVQREQLLGWDGRVLLERRLEQYRKVEGLLLPQVVEIEQDSTVVALEYERWKINEGLDAGRFAKGIDERRLMRVGY